MTGTTALEETLEELAAIRHRRHFIDVQVEYVAIESLGRSAASSGLGCVGCAGAAAAATASSVAVGDRSSALRVVPSDRRSVGYGSPIVLSRQKRKR